MRKRLFEDLIMKTLLPELIALCHRDSVPVCSQAHTSRKRLWKKKGRLACCVRWIG